MLRVYCVYVRCTALALYNNNIPTESGYNNSFLISFSLSFSILPFSLFSSFHSILSAQFVWVFRWILRLFTDEMENRIEFRDGVCSYLLHRLSVSLLYYYGYHAIVMQSFLMVTYRGSSLFANFICLSFSFCTQCAL